MQDVEARQEVLGVVDVAGRQPLEQRPIAEPAAARPPGTSASLCAASRSVAPLLREMDDQHASFDRGDVSGAELGVEAVGQVVADGPG